MTLQINRARLTLGELTSRVPEIKLTPVDESTMRVCLLLSEHTWVADIDGKVACTWGLIPPTMLSERAYLWMFHTPLAEEHKFMLVRHSQIMVREMLEEYPTICGHCDVDSTSSIRWMKWLGAEFGEPDGRRVPFVIRK